jgi:hypothetical protein
MKFLERNFATAQPHGGVAGSFIGNRPVCRRCPGFDNDRAGSESRRPVFKTGRAESSTFRPDFVNGRPGFDGSRPDFQTGCAESVASCPGFFRLCAVFLTLAPFLKAVAPIYKPPRLAFNLLPQSNLRRIAAKRSKIHKQPSPVLSDTLSHRMGAGRGEGRLCFSNSKLPTANS